MKFNVVIPARYTSTRLPGKVLLEIRGKPVIQYVYENACKSGAEQVIIATDDQRIVASAQSFDAEVHLTASNHKSGTDRIAEASNNIDAEIIVNVQGDEALVNPQYIDKVVNELQENPDINVAILVNPYFKKNSPSDIKVVLNNNNDVLYLSRSDIPSNSRTKSPSTLKAYHILPFRKEFLLEFTQWEKGTLEQIEFNEYLRILEHGHRIRAVHVESDVISVDTADDLEYVRKRMRSDPWLQKYII